MYQYFCLSCPPPPVLPSFLIFQDSFFCKFLLKTFLQLISKCGSGFWQQQIYLFIYLFCENIFIFPSSLKDAFPWIQTSHLVGNFCQCQTSLSPPCIHMKNLMLVELVSPYGQCVISLWLFSRLKYVFGFQNFNHGSFLA